MRLRWTAPLALALTACTPALDWREVRPPGSATQLQLPCKPASHARQVALAGAPVEMALYACTADGVTYALGFADVQDPARVTPALEALAQAAQDHLGGAAPRAASAARVDGMTPNPRAVHLELAGRLPDGRAVVESVVVFAYGTRVVQATALGERLDRPALETFIGSLKVRP
jgi:hypothetical protein